MSLPPPDRYAVVGHPVAHSRSPFIHRAFAEQSGERIEYGRIDSPPERFERTLREWIASADPAAGLGRVRGCNITVPLKFLVLPLARRSSERARLAEAANVLRFDAETEGGWFADNSDGIGLVRDIVGHADCRITGRRVLLVGAGGAAAGVLGPLIEAGAAAVTVANRTRERAEALVERHRALAERFRCRLDAAALAAPGEAYTIVVNASASSLAGAPVPVPAAVLGSGALAVDLMYGAPAKPFLDWAAARGAVARDGLGMLVEQAAEAFEIWRGVRPRTAPVLAALRAELAAAR